MNAAAAGLIALACSFALAADGFDDSDIRLFFAPANLWRDASNAFVGRREGDKFVLVYDFLEDASGGRNYSRCPPANYRDASRALSCEAVQGAVADSIRLWSEAAGRFSFRRRGASGEKVNVWIAWTRPKREGPIGWVVHNSRDAEAELPQSTKEDARGFDQPFHPGLRVESAALFLNDAFCWHLEDESVCPEPVTMPSGKRVSNNASIRHLSLHEFGHVLGFGHFTRSSIMGLSGGSGRYELTPYDRDAARGLCDRAAASFAP